MIATLIKLALAIASTSAHRAPSATEIDRAGRLLCESVAAVADDPLARPPTCEALIERANVGDDAFADNCHRCDDQIVCEAFTGDGVVLGACVDDR